MITRSAMLHRTFCRDAISQHRPGDPCFRLLTIVNYMFMMTFVIRSFAFDVEIVNYH